MPTHYLYEFTKHLRKDYTHLQNRLTEFYNGDEDGPFLARPPQQCASFHARYQHLVYDLAPRGFAALAAEGSGLRRQRSQTEPFVHQLMTACVAASFELIAQHHGLRYIPRTEILGRARGGHIEGARPLMLPLGTGECGGLVPDDLFGLEYPGIGFRFFALEADRNTESIERRRLGAASIARKVAGYLSVLRGRTFREAWGVPNLHVLIVTTNERHASNILAHIAGHSDPQHRSRFAVAVRAEFGAHWRVPQLILHDLLAEPWQTAEGDRNLRSAVALPTPR